MESLPKPTCQGCGVNGRHSTASRPGWKNCIPVVFFHCGSELEDGKFHQSDRCKIAGLEQENADLVIVNLLLRGENEKLKVALRESVKLQSHYARLLNGWDGGERTIFGSMDEWLASLDECKAFGESR